MKYIIDIDALKDCIAMLAYPEADGEYSVTLDNIHAMIDYFPKDEYPAKPIMREPIDNPSYPPRQVVH